MKFVLLPTGFSVSVEAKSLLSYCFYKSCQTCGSINEKKNREESGQWSEIVQIGRWRDSFSSVFCTLIKNALSTMRTLVTSEICYKTKCKNLIMNIVWRNQHTTSRYMMDAVISNKLNQH